MRRLRRLRFEPSTAKVRVIRVLLADKLIGQQQGKGSTTACEVELFSNCIIEIVDDGVLVARGQVERRISEHEYHVPRVPRPEPVAAQPEPKPEPVAAQPEPKPEPVAAQPEPEPEPKPEPEPEPVAAQPEPKPEPVAAQPEPEPEPEPVAEPKPT